MITGEEFSLFTPVPLPSKPPPRRGHRWNERKRERRNGFLSGIYSLLNLWNFFFSFPFLFSNNSNFTFEYFMGRFDGEIWGSNGVWRKLKKIDIWYKFFKLYVSLRGEVITVLLLLSVRWCFEDRTLSRLQFKIHLDTGWGGRRSSSPRFLDSPLNLIRSRA